VREIRTHGSIGRGLETDPRRWLHGHEAGNGGYSQAGTYGAPHRPSTLPRSDEIAIESLLRKGEDALDEGAVRRLADGDEAEERSSVVDCFFQEIAEATINGAWKEYLADLASVPLLIIDDLGMRKLPHTAPEDLLELVSGATSELQRC